MEYQITKRLNDYPFSHRQHTHDGHCSLIHGHNWDFEFTFGSDTLDENGFVYDFGKLGWLKEWLEEHFDHTMVLSLHDPYLQEIGALVRPKKGKGIMGVRHKLADLVVLESCSCEGIAKHVFNEVGKHLHKKTEGRVELVSVTVYEDRKNSAKYGKS